MYRSSSTKKRTYAPATNRSTSQIKSRVSNPAIGFNAAVNNYTTSSSAYGSGIQLNSNGAVVNHSYISTSAVNNILPTRNYGQTTIDTAHRRTSNSSMGHRKSSLTSGTMPLTSNENDRGLHLPNLNNRNDGRDVLHKTPRLSSGSRSNSQKDDFDSPPFVPREIKPPVSPLQVPLDATEDNDMSLYYSTKAKDCSTDSVTLQLLEDRKKSNKLYNNSNNTVPKIQQPSKIPTCSKSRNIGISQIHSNNKNNNNQQIQQQEPPPLPPSQSSNYNNSNNNNDNNSYDYDIPHSVDHIGDGLCGLQNLGNTCFMNSILQCLAHIVPLRDYFISGKFASHLNKTNQKKADLARAFAGLLNDIWNKDSGKNKVVAPYDVKTAIGKCSRQFSGYNQQDSHEFLIFLLDYLHDSVNQITNPPKYVEIDDSHVSSTDEAAKLWWNNYKERNHSIITELFSGQMHSTITCDICGSVSNNYDPFIGLPVPLPGSRNNSFSSGLSGTKGGGLNSSVSLEDCLNLFTQSEHLSGMDEVYCRKCKGHKPSTKTNEIYRAPKILIIQLKRFSQASYRRDKLSTSVKIPKMGLDLTKHMASIYIYI